MTEAATTMYGWAFYVLVLLALFHFIFEAIVAPSLRIEIRFELFRLRDELRHLKMQMRDEFPDEEFSVFHDSVNTMLASLEWFDLATLMKANRYLADNRELRARMMERLRVMENCQIQAVQDIHGETLVLAFTAFKANSGGLAMLGVPLLAVWICTHWVVKQLAGLLTMSEPDLEHVTPIFATANMPK